MACLGNVYSSAEDKNLSYFLVIINNSGRLVISSTPKLFLHLHVHVHVHKWYNYTVLIINCAYLTNDLLIVSICPSSICGRHSNEESCDQHACTHICITVIMTNAV